MTARQWSDWLRRAGARAIKVVGPDGRETEIRVGANARKWSDAAGAVMACDPVRVSALDEHGRVLRSWTDDEREAPDEGDAAGAPGVLDINKIAALVLEATDRGAQRHAEAFRLAYESQGMLIQLFADRLAKLEQAWQAALETRIEQAGSGDDRIAEALIQRALGSGDARKEPQ